MNKIEKDRMQDHLSHLIDKLSAISATAESIGMAAGEVVVKSRVAGDKTVKELTAHQNEAIDEAYSIINQMRSLLKDEKTQVKLYSIVRFVQDSDEDYNRIEAVFSGIRPHYCEGNSQPVIDYLSDWDDMENELSEEEPMIGKMGDTIYTDENGVYTLLYNSNLGGCFMLYREATEDEIDWHNDHKNESE